MVEDCGLRCNYHGWLFDRRRQVPGPALRGDRASRGAFQGPRAIKAYRWRPRPACSGPTWDRSRRRSCRLGAFTWRNGFKQIVFAEIPCNWFQCQENSIDPVHFEWLHSNWSVSCRGDQRPDAADPSQDRLRRVRVRLRLPPHPEGQSDRTSCGPSAASACGRTACSPAATSSGACRSTTRTP